MRFEIDAPVLTVFPGGEEGVLFRPPCTGPRQAKAGATSRAGEGAGHAEVEVTYPAAAAAARQLSAAAGAAGAEVFAAALGGGLAPWSAAKAPPPGDKHQPSCELRHFMAHTGEGQQCARSFMTKHDWGLDSAVDDFFDGGCAEGEGVQAALAAVPRLGRHFSAPPPRPPPNAASRRHHSAGGH